MAYGSDPVEAASRIDPIPSVTENIVHRARLTVVRNVARRDLRDVLEMLGIYNPPTIRVIEDAA